jgi:hypothetical protein
MVSFANFSEVEVIAQKTWPICLVFCASTSGFGFKLFFPKSSGIFRHSRRFPLPEPAFNTNLYRIQRKCMDTPKDLCLAVGFDPEHAGQ